MTLILCDRQHGYCAESRSVPPIHVHPEPVHVTLFGKRALTSAIELRQSREEARRNTSLQPAGSEAAPAPWLLT